jgi:hypothetical protein
MKRIALALVALLAADAGAAGKIARAPRKPAKTKPAPAAPKSQPTSAAAPAASDVSVPAAPEAPPAPRAETPPPPAEKAEKAEKPEKAEKSEKPRAAGPTVEALRAEYDELRDALFRSRARRETLESALFSTQLLPTIVWEGGRHHSVKRAEVRFDGVRLWESNEGLTADKAVSLAPKSAPPGPHVLGVRIEVRSRDDPKLGYVSDQSFALSLPEGKKTSVEITVDEDGDAPSYNPEIEIEVVSK